MGIFDGLKSVINEAVKEENINQGNHSESFQFSKIPTNVSELQALPEANLNSPYAAVALAMIALCGYKQNPGAVYEMLDFLNGPDEVSAYTKSFIKDRLEGKTYKPFSFFEGATVQNNYTPSEPFTIKVSANPNSFIEENWATLYVQSAGADSPRPMKLRKKPSTGQWFVVDIQCLSDIRIPVAEDPWA